MELWTEWHRPLDFRIPHSVTVSPATGHIWVADRMNNRLKVFDPIEPKLVKSCQMDGGQPYSVRFSKDGSHLIVAQLQNDTIAFVSSQFADQSTCKKLGSVKLPPGSKPHLVDVDKFNGAFYVGNIGDPPSCLRFIPSY
ncbi:putative NHL repeat-containing protein 3 [Apostichopus japonicus]|uniref:Putative NHL repeat-containing protein 3 n=1 Tax=Stichopus japonicus TaxID=307972 RepID=A0A2G8KZC7_STIJA|nr:putative NHL repeat-containing protein 3 [Apostichopus japonicus]